MKPIDASVSRPIEGGVSFTLRHRIFRAIWNATWLLFASWTPPPFHRWRAFLLRLAGAKVHPSAHVYGSAAIWYPPNLVMQAHSCLGPNVRCYNMALISLGERAIVSQGAYLCAGTHDIDDINHQLIVRPIVIGSDAWIAAEAFVGPGVSVGNNAVLGARSVLFRNADASCVYVGNPANYIRKRRNKPDTWEISQ